jgi:hypothetical protein
VDSHRAHIWRKLQFETRAELVLFALATDRSDRADGKGGGVSARPLPIPINPALLQHADQRRQSLEKRQVLADHQWQTVQGRGFDKDRGLRADR